MHINVLASLRRLLMVALAGLPVASAAAQEKAAPAAQCLAVHGAILAQTADGGWESIAAQMKAPADRLLVALFGAEFSSLNGAVAAKVVADVGQRGPFPVLEAALRFHPNTQKDLDVTLDRGILILMNTKKSGAANVQLRVSDETFDVTLSEPMTKLAVEIYGRHVPGPPNLASKKNDAPVANVAFFALAGEAVVSTSQQATRLHAPPGPAMYLWDNLTRSADVNRFETLPDFVKPMDDKEKKTFETIAGFAKAWLAKPGPIGKAVEQAVASDDAMERKAAVVALGALDDLPRLVQTLSDKSHADVRDMAILTIRTWLGRAPGQSIRLHQYLTKNEGYTSTQAKNLLYLFNGIERSKLQEPGTYDLLILALNNSKMSGRHLAHWHLVRLVPDGKAIAYDAAAAEPMRLQSIAEWRRLVPEGELPMPPKKK